MGSVGKMVIKQVFKQIDANHNGTLEINEALSALKKIKKLLGK
jgi:hypothetical protein